MKALVKMGRPARWRVLDVPMPARLDGHVLVQTAWSAWTVGWEPGRAPIDDTIQEKSSWRPKWLTWAEDDARPTPTGWSLAGTVLALGDGVSGWGIGAQVGVAAPILGLNAEVVAVPPEWLVALPAGVSAREATLIGPMAWSLGVAARLPRLLGASVVISGDRWPALLLIGVLARLGVRVAYASGHARQRAAAQELGTTRLIDGAEAGADDPLRGWMSGAGLDAIIVTDGAVTGSSLSPEWLRPGGLWLTTDHAAPAIETQRLARAGVEAVWHIDDIESTAGLATWRERLSLAVEWLSAKRVATPQLLDAAALMPLDLEETAVAETPRRSIVCIEWDAGALPQRHIEITDVAGAAVQPGADTERERLALMGQPESGADVGPPPVGIGWLGQSSSSADAIVGTFPKDRGRLVACCALDGPLAGREAVRRWRFAHALAEPSEVWNHPDVQLVVMTGRHDQHATWILDALRAGKTVMADRPLCLTTSELERLARALRTQGPQLYGGFSTLAESARPSSIAEDSGAWGRAGARLTMSVPRRFSSALRAAKQRLAEEAGGAPLHLHLTARYAPAREDSVLSRVDGGGRLLGDLVGHADTLSWLAGAPITLAYARPVSGQRWESIAILLHHANGVVSQVSLLASLGIHLPHERWEITTPAVTFLVDGDNSLHRHTAKRHRHDKIVPESGHAAQALATLDWLQKTTAPPPVPMIDLLRAQATGLAVIESLKSGEPIELE